MEKSCRPNRREVLAAVAAMPVGIALVRSAFAQDVVNQIGRRGVIYDTGTYFGYEGYLSRMSWHETDVRREITTIGEQLRCNTVQIVGTDHSRLEFAARIAADQGLQVWLQPRLFEKDAEAQLAHMAEGARMAAVLAEDGVDIVFNVGCETTLFQHGFLPGDTFAERAIPLFSASPEQAGDIMRRLNTFLSSAAETARKHFPGQITYSAGGWEQVDWSVFDLVAVNLYRDRNNRAVYRDALRSQMRHGKPLVITEFGSCTFEGAGNYGAAGFMIVDYGTEPPTIPEGYVRSEEEQAREIVELLGIFAEENVAGAFVYNFLAQFDTHSDDPRQDLDMASHAIVKTMPGPADAPLVWEPKQAFHAIAEIYGDRAGG